MEDREISELEKSLERIWEVARGFGLDPYPVRFEVVPATVMYEIGSYALPGRYSHWTFGKAYHRMKTMYDFGLSKIYEGVINTKTPSGSFSARHQPPHKQKSRDQQPDSKQDGHRARAGPCRLLQKQHLLLEDEPAHGGECFDTRAADDGV